MAENDEKRRIRALSVAIFGLATLLAAATSSPVHTIGAGDEAKYLALARSEPAHRLFFQSFYVMHPPAYPWAIRLASFLAGDLVRAAIALGIACNAALVVVAFRLGLVLSGDLAASLAGALIFGASRQAAFTSHGVFREPFQVLAVLSLVLFLLSSGKKDGPIGLARLAGGAALGVLSVLTFDLNVALVPCVAASGFVLGKRRAFLALALVMLVAWLSWAAVRKHVLESGKTYPAGIDGMVEETEGAPPLALLNPNFFPETKAHNDYFWPRRPTPLRPERLVGPALLEPESPVLDQGGSVPYVASARAIIVLALVGFLSFFLKVRNKGGEDALRALATVLAPAALVSAPTFLGGQARYAATLAPVLCVLAGIGAFELMRTVLKRRDDEPACEPARARVVLVVLGVLLAVTTAVVRPHLAFGRPTVVLGRSVAEVVRAVAPGSKIAAQVDWPPGLAWLLPDEKVVALPLRVEALDRFLASYDPDLLVVPLGGPLVPPEGASEEDFLHAKGARVLEEIAARTRGSEPSLVPLGFAVEAETSDASRIHVFTVLARVRPGRPTPPAFGFHMSPGEAEAAALSIETGEALIPEIVTLANNVAAIASSDPGAARLERALERRLGK